MKYKLKLVIMVICIFMFYSCNKNNKIKKAEWLIGTWENTTPQGSLYEKWLKVNENELSGISYFFDNKDTITIEKITLIQTNDSIFYTVTVESHNNNLPISFLLKTISGNEMIFENTKHDFPQIITYRKIGTDSLVAEISGIVNEEKKDHIISMRKIQ